MKEPQGGLLELVRQLDALGPAVSLVDLAKALESARLTLDDVAPYVESNPRNYNRALVALRGHYELLVMTWLPGQTSVPHDHAGSICAMQVLRGEAIEGSYRVGDDGYAELDYETTVHAGEITAGQDAGIHSVSNPKGAAETLVTVHAYAPPLRDFRRFVRSPLAATQASAKTVEDQRLTIVVVGGGFSGSMAAAQLLRKAHSLGVDLSVVVVERRGAVGEGIAYGTRELAHLLNVPAGRMSAWPDRPDDFLNWASTRQAHVHPGDFLPRQWYGEYVRDTLLTTAREVGESAHLSVLFDEVRRVARRPEGGWLVHLARGASIRARAVVLAIGHRPPDDPLGSKWEGPASRYLVDPWRPFAMNVVRPDESVLILGSGLTAVDAVLTLSHQQRSAPITLVSRRGLLPQSHSAVALAPVDVGPIVAELMAAPGGVKALALCKLVRRKALALAAQGIDWRSVVDSLRQHTAPLWQKMPANERRRFLRHLRPFWEIHRHRMAPGIAERLGEMRDCDQLHFVAGRVLAVQATDDKVRVTVEVRAESQPLTIDVDWVVNCTGPAPSNYAAANPAIGSLLVDGWLRRDELGLGIDTSPQGNAIDRQGKTVDDLLIVGTLRKSALWESTAVPELRSQAATIADRVMRLVMQELLASKQAAPA